MKLLRGDDHALLRAFLLFYLMLAVAFTGALLYGKHKHAVWVDKHPAAD
jgi:hypothetical protein